MWLIWLGTFLLVSSNLPEPMAFKYPIKVHNPLMLLGFGGAAVTATLVMIAV